MKVLVTGSSGLIGSEAVEYYDREGHQVADVVAQEYGRYFSMKVGIFRGGCLT
jgi:CDP-paratose 2-epimerase